MVAAHVVSLLILLAPGTEPDVAGRIIAVAGQATLTRPKQTPAPAVRGDVLHAGDAIKTGADSSLRLLLQDDSVLDMAAGTSLKLDAFSFKAKERSRLARITMFIGRLWARVSPNMGDEQNFHVSTPNAVAGVRGTSLVVDVNKGGETQVTVVNGSVQVKDNRGNAQLLGALMQSQVSRSGHTVHAVPPAALGSLRASLGNLRSTFMSGDAKDRLHTYTTAQASTQAPSAPAPPEMPSKPKIATNPAATAAPLPPPLDLDPTKNFARLNIQVQIKGAK